MKTKMQTDERIEQLKKKLEKLQKKLEKQAMLNKMIYVVIICFSYMHALHGNVMEMIL